MLTKDAAHAAIEVAMHPPRDLYCAAGVDRVAYEKFLEADLRASLCEPYKITIQEIGSKLNEPIAVYCVASRSGTRLFYQPSTHRFFGAHGQASFEIARQAVQGSPLACWAGAVRANPGKVG